MEQKVMRIEVKTFSMIKIINYGNCRPSKLISFEYKFMDAAK